MSVTGDATQPLIFAKPAGEEEDLLVNATSLPLEEAASLVRRFGGAAIPAHVDREANGILAMLGDLPAMDRARDILADPDRLDHSASFFSTSRSSRISASAMSIWAAKSGS